MAIAKQSDGTVQITFTLLWKKIETEREKTIKELSQNVEVPGFRKGKAPVAKARERLDQQFVLEHTLSHILPALFSEAVKEHKLKAAMYPKFELISAKEGEDWQVRATTAEIPEFSLGDYKKIVKDTKPTDIWTPEKGLPAQAGDQKGKQELSREQKENIAIKALTEHYKFTIPKILIEEEVNSRLSSLLERIEKLGMSLESYLASIKKDVQKVRDEYRESSEQAIRLDIVFSKIAEKEAIKATEQEIQEFISMAQTGGKNTVSQDQKNTIGAFLIKRKVLDTLAKEVS